MVCVQFDLFWKKFEEEELCWCIWRNKAHFCALLNNWVFQKNTTRFDGCKQSFKRLLLSSFHPPIQQLVFCNKFSHLFTPFFINYYLIIQSQLFYFPAIFNSIYFYFYTIFDCLVNFIIPSQLFNFSHHYSIMYLISNSHNILYYQA